MMPFKTALIIANGDFPKHAIPFQKLKQAEYIICCDGMFNHLKEHHIMPDVVIGDFDSIDQRLMQAHAHLMVKVIDQNTNDLTKAVNFAIEKGFQKIEIVGGTGKREDHTIGNISLLFTYAKRVNVQLFSDYGFFTVINQTSQLPSFKGQQVSIFSENPTVGITSTGLTYALNNLALPSLWNGTLNEAQGERFSISFNTPNTVIVYQTY